MDKRRSEKTIVSQSFNLWVASISNRKTERLGMQPKTVSGSDELLGAFHPVCFVSHPQLPIGKSTWRLVPSVAAARDSRNHAAFPVEPHQRASCQLPASRETRIPCNDAN